MTSKQKQAALRIAMKVTRNSAKTSRTYAVLNDGTVEFINKPTKK